MKKKNTEEENENEETPDDVTILESSSLKVSVAQQEIATMKQSLEASVRELMVGNGVSMVCITYIHADGTGTNTAILRPPPEGATKDSSAWEMWEANKRASLVHGGTYLKSGYDILSKMVIEAMSKGL